MKDPELDKIIRETFLFSLARTSESRDSLAGPILDPSIKQMSGAVKTNPTKSSQFEISLLIFAYFSHSYFGEFSAT